MSFTQKDAEQLASILGCSYGEAVTILSAIKAMGFKREAKL